MILLCVDFTVLLSSTWKTNIAKNCKPWFQIKQTYETRNYLLEEIIDNGLIGEKYKTGCRVLDYFQHFLIFISALRGWVWIYTFYIIHFASLVGIVVGIISSTLELKVCALFTGIRNYKSVVKRKKQDHIVLLVKSKLNTTEVLISKALSDSYINHDQFVLVKTMLRKYYQMKEEI